ncbi:MAG TPA: hypothetical protein VL098_04775 [Flavipsychrobacter sp.]|nr:hypothetical protein [Flavipsychrobacter sp.]
MKYVLSLFCGLFSFAMVKAQSYGVVLHSVDGKENLLENTVPVPKEFPDGTAAYAYVRSLVTNLQKNGFLAVSLDSLSIHDSQYHAYIYLGDVYKWSKVNLDSLPENVLLQYGFNKIQWKGKNLEPQVIAAISEKLLKWAEQNGYPFASVWLDIKEQQHPGAIEAVFRWDKGNQQRLDTIHLEGTAKVSRNYLLRYLDLKQGELYNEKKIRSVPARLQELPFLQEASPVKMEFQQYGNQLHIYLKEKKANTLSAIVGLLPNSVETGKFLLTADAAFLFQNILGNGEYINVIYQNLQYKSPRFKAQLSYPYLLNTSVGLDASFDLFKKDTTFRRTTFQGGFRYQMNAMDYVRVFYQNQSNRLGVVDTNYVKTNKQLPADADVSAAGGGIELSISRVDNRIHPRKGIEGKIGCTVLKRTMRRSDEVLNLKDVSGFDYASLYDSFSQRNNQVFLNGSLNYYLPLARKIVLKTAYQGAYMQGGNLFRNELYQIGGFRLLRGFDEQSIYASQYHVVSIELRLLLDPRSYFYFFSDNGWVQTGFPAYRSEDVYNGFGFGTTLETKTGLFSISYALGRHEGSPVQLRQSKIHFGYAAYF